MWASEPEDVASAVAPRFPSTGHGVLESPGRCVVERVTEVGTFRCQQHLLYLANTMVDQPIGLEETGDGIWAIYFSTVLLATFDERDCIIRG